jgi:quinol monooxygenase YgiN
MNAKQIFTMCASVMTFFLGGPVAAEEVRHRYVRLAELEIDPGQLENFSSAVKEGVEAAVRMEPGVLALYVVYEKEQPNRVRVFEMYTDEAAYQKHLQTPHFRKFRDTTDKMVKSRRLLDAMPIVLGEKPAAAPHK